MRSVRLSVLIPLVVTGLTLTNQLQAAPVTLFGPLPYLQTSDSPFAGLSMGYFYLEDFEDFALNTPGVTASAGYSTKPTWPASSTDSVDGDDGVVDGSGNAGNSWFSTPGDAGITFTFDAGVLGSLPTHAGIVWTDGRDPITFIAYDADGAPVGTILANGIADGVTTGTTAEDRFFGISYPDGIAKITILDGVGGGIEVDHLQYGAPIPVPATVVLVGIGAGLTDWLRRRRAI